MVALFCNQKLEEYHVLLHRHRPVLLAFCVLNLGFAVLATVENVLVIHALRSSSTLPGNLKKMFLSLAFSDFAVGFLGQSMLGIITAIMLKMTANGNYDLDFLCPTLITVCYSVIYFLTCVSFFSIIAIAVDRLLVIFLHLRYHELVTSKRVIFTLASLWMACGVATFIFTQLPNHQIIFVAVIEICGLLVATTAYIYIYRVIRSLTTVHPQREHQPHNHKQNSNRERKSASSAFLVYIVFLACFLPNFCCIMLLTSNRSKVSFILANHISGFLVLLNSSLNPVIYCWRYQEIRRIVKNSLKKLLFIR
ncbi:unnamed protein product [Porites lobata]|uniref:G-protein coupled receptors family 1 profile domain-containing protein n=1 Tax=Porites lobata TaxID=104759 RepID=A0ABN8N4K4_9CNID|nr:unnamed protein product [Porites lobata]